MNELTKVLDENIPTFFKDMETHGLPAEIADGIIINPLDLSLTFKDSRWYIQERHKEYKLIISEEFINLSNDIEKCIENNESVVIKGKHGIGKSTFINLLIAKSIHVLPTFINYTKTKKILDKKILESLSKKNLYLLYDPLEPLAYAQREEFTSSIFKDISEDITSTIKDLIEYKIKFILIISEDTWNNIESKIHHKIYKKIDLNRIFKTDYVIQNIIKSYSNDEEVTDIDSLSQKVLKYNDGYLLLAAYIGRMLQTNTTRENIDILFRNSSNEVKKFFINYVWKVILNEDKNYILGPVITIFLRLFVGKIPIDLATDIPLMLEEFHLSPNNQEFAEWISDLDEHLVLASMKDLFIKNAEEFSKQNPELKLLISGTKKIVEFVNKREPSIQSLDYKLLAMIQNWIKEKIVSLEKKDLEKFISFYCDCLVGKSLENYEATNNLYNYFIDHFKLFDAGFYILFGKYPFVPDLLDFSVPYIYIIKTNENINNIKNYFQFQNILAKMLFKIVCYSISSNVDSISTVTALKGLRMLLKKYTLFFPLYWSIINRILAKIDIDNSNEIISLLSLVTDLINEPIYFYKIMTMSKFKRLGKIISSVDYNPISIILYCRCRLYDFYITNNNKEFIGLVGFIKNYRNRFPQSGNMLFLYIQDILIMYEINNARDIDNHLDQLNNELQEAINSVDQSFIDEFLAVIDPFENKIEFKNNWFDYIRQNIIHYQFLTCIHRNELQEARQKLHELGKSNPIFNLRINFQLFCLDLLQYNSNKSQIDNMIKTIENNLYQTNSLTLKSMMTIIIIFEDIHKTEYLYQKYLSLFSGIDFSKILVYAYFAAYKIRIGELNFEGEFYEMISIFGNQWDFSKSSKTEFDQIFSKYNNLTMNLLFKLSGFIVLLLFLYLKNEKNFMKKLIKYGSVNFPQINIKTILLDMLKSDLNNLDLFMDKIRKLSIMSLILSI